MVLLAWYRDIAENDFNGEGEKIRRGRGERRSLVKPSGARTIRTSVPRERCRRRSVARTHDRRLDWPGRNFDRAPAKTARCDCSLAGEGTARKRGNRFDHSAGAARGTWTLRTTKC